MWILTPVYLFEHKPLPFFIAVRLLALPSRSHLRTGVYAIRYLSSVCLLESLSVMCCPSAHRGSGGEVLPSSHTFVCYLTRLHVIVTDTFFITSSTPL